jgi:hypothetical protein
VGVCLIVAAWTLILVLVGGLCLAAQAGDRREREAHAEARPRTGPDRAALRDVA